MFSSTCEFCLRKLSQFVTGLSEGIFSFHKFQSGYILLGLGVENVGKFCGHLEYITAIWYILWPFGNVVLIWYIFPVLVFVSRQIWQPWWFGIVCFMVCSTLTLHFQCIKSNLTRK
jgi:hypothetical protein